MDSRESGNDGGVVPRVCCCWDFTPTLTLSLKGEGVLGGAPAPPAFAGAGSNPLPEGEGTVLMEVVGDEIRIDGLRGVVIDFGG